MQTDELGSVGLGVAAADAADLVVGLTAESVSAGGRFEPQISRMTQMREKGSWRKGIVPRSAILRYVSADDGRLVRYGFWRTRSVHGYPFAVTMAVRLQTTSRCLRHRHRLYSRPG